MKKRIYNNIIFFTGPDGIVPAELGEVVLAGLLPVPQHARPGVHRQVLHAEKCFTLLSQLYRSDRLEAGELGGFLKAVQDLQLLRLTEREFALARNVILFRQVSKTVWFHRLFVFVLL